MPHLDSLAVVGRELYDVVRFGEGQIQNVYGNNRARTNDEDPTWFSNRLSDE
jgi:hypothetical protein